MTRDDSTQDEDEDWKPYGVIGLRGVHKESVSAVKRSLTGIHTAERKSKAYSQGIGLREGRKVFFIRWHEDISELDQIQCAQRAASCWDTIKNRIEVVVTRDRGETWTKVERDPIADMIRTLEALREVKHVNDLERMLLNVQIAYADVVDVYSEKLIDVRNRWPSTEVR